MSVNSDFLARAEKVFVGGVNSPVRSFRRVEGKPLIIKRAQGAFIEDVEGKKYLDLVMSYGPHLFGHHYDPILKTLAKSLEEGLCYGMTSEREIQWGEKMLSFLPPRWKVRALSSGTEACMTSIRLARGYTGRDVIVKCSGHYHGHVDSLLFDAGSGLATLSEESVPDSAGVPQSLGKLLKIIPFNDVSALEKVFNEFGEQIAAFIFEPIMGNMGVVLPEENFLKKAHELTQKYKALLILDEVMTGFRVAKNSAWGRFDLQPDLVTFGKIVGGGSALSALAGDAKILDSLAPLGKVYQAGTLSGNPIGVSAGLAMLEEIDRCDPYPSLEKLGEKLEKTLQNVALKKGIQLSVVRCASMLSTHFRQEKPRNAAETRDIDYELYKKFFWSAVKHGVMLPPSPFEAYFLATAHCQHEDQLLSSFEKILSDI